MHAHLLELASAAKTFAVGLDHEQAHALGAGGRVGLADHHHEVGQEAVADEGLAAVDDVLVALAHGGRAQRLHVGAAAGLGDGHGQDLLAGADAGQPLLLLLVGAQARDVGRHDVRVQPERGAAHAGVGQLFSHDGRVTEVAAAAAVLGGQRDAQQAFLAGLAPDLARDHAGLVPCFLVGHAFALHEAAHRGAELFVIFAIDAALDLHGERLLEEIGGWTQWADATLASAGSA
ncbi:hypothetical protein D3C86_1440980 [compost metagenome]